MIYRTGLISLAIQFIVGFINTLALNIKTETKDELLNDLLIVELVVQIIEFIFYMWLIYSFKRVFKNITPFRYVDWFITTPLMLITLSAFLNHDGNKSNRLSGFLSDNRDSIAKIVGLNASMLLFGLFGELGYMSSYVSTALGFIPFALNFKYIKDKFLRDSDDVIKKTIFYWFVFFWSLYGVFALMNHTIKNTGYNILDIFSKNFFGLFLAYTVWTKQK